MIVCVLVPSYKLAAAVTKRPELRDVATLVADRFERGHVLELSPAAHALGARAGMTLVQAQACAREAYTVLDDPLHNAGLWMTILEALDAASPLVEDAAQGTAYVEMRGLEGTPARWLGAIRETLAPVELPFRLAAGANKFVARAAALVADGSVWPAGEAPARLAPLPLEVLDIDPSTAARLALLGITTLGALAALPHGPFVRRFGKAAARWHRNAGGIDETPLVPRARELRIEAALYGEGTAEREDQVLFALRRLVGRVIDDLTFVGQRCGRLHLTLECEDASVSDLATALAEPSANAATIFEVLRARLEGVTLQSPVVGLRLAAAELEEAGATLSLFSGEDPDPETLGLVLARLEAALGEKPALRARLIPGNRPEARFAYEPFDLNTTTQKSAAVLPERATLQYRLLEPRKIDVTLQRGVPAFVGTPPQAVLDLAGPCRVAETWWDQPLERDDYDVLLEDGSLYRISREGAHWFVRGTYD